MYVLERSSYKTTCISAIEKNAYLRLHGTWKRFAESDAAQRPRIDLKKRSYLDQILSPHESLYPIGLKSAIIEIPHGGNFSTK